MMAINIKDYLIDQADLDWQKMLAEWGELLPATFSIWLVNCFGDLIIVVEDGAVYHVDVAGGTVSRVANNRDHFAELIDISQNANNWLMIPLVHQCVAAGMLLQRGKCYGFKTPPLIGGEYVIGNVTTVDLAQNYGFLADLWSQTKDMPDMPDGTRVKLVFGPRPH